MCLNIKTLVEENTEVIGIIHLKKNFVYLFYTFYRVATLPGNLEKPRI